METARSSPLIVIVGPTASGKSALAMALARQFPVEIIAADSRTIYKGMDIGTAKPTVKERRSVPHHLIDITTPDKPITVVDFKALASRAIEEIHGRGRIPMLVGGTGLYIDAVIYDYRFPKRGDPEERKKLLRLSVAELQHLLADQTIPLPNNERNPRHLIRAIETKGQTGHASPLRADTIVLGLNPTPESLRYLIVARVAKMFADGLEQEVRNLQSIYGWDIPPMQTIGYQEFRPYFSHTQDLRRTQELIELHTRALAKRQKTWFKRNESIHWVKQQRQAVELITTFLNKQCHT